MSIWKTSDQKEIAPSNTYELGGGNLVPIPEGTSVLAAPVEAKWKEYEAEDYISIQWQVLAPIEFKNRRVFQKIKVNESDPSKADRAKKMLVAIDANAGGHLIAAAVEPNDSTLTQHLVGKPMVLKLGVWEINDKSGNWVQAVSPKAGTAPPATAAPAPAPAPAPAGKFDDDIPF
jgi:hypothetical protein